MELIELSSAPRESEGERVPVCIVDGEKITMSADVPAGVVLGMFRKLHRGEYSMGDDVGFLERCLGSDQLDKVLAADLSMDQWKGIVSRVTGICLGRADIDAESASSGNSPTG